MAVIIPTNAVEIARFANGLFGLQLGFATSNSVAGDVSAYGGLNAAFNNYYTLAYGSATTASVAAAMTANLGITTANGVAAADITSATAYITAQLNAAPASARGAVVKSVLDMWANIASDPVNGAKYGAAATTWNTQIGYAVTYAGAINLDLTVAQAAIVGQNATYTVNATPPTFTVGLGTIGSGSNSTLTLNDGASTATATITAPGGVSLNVGTLSVNGSSTDAVVVDLTQPAFATVAALNINANGAITANGGVAVTTSTNNANTTVGTTTGPTGAISVTSTTTAANTIAVGGGTNVTINATGVTTNPGAINVGGVGITSPSGVISITETGATTTSAALAPITVKGGTSVVITENLNEVASLAALGADTVTGGTVSVTGISTTTSVSVTQTPKAVAQAPIASTTPYAAGVTGYTAGPGLQGATTVSNVAQAGSRLAVQGATPAGVTITDAVGANSGANSISTVTLANYGNSTITSTALTTLNLSSGFNAAAVANGATNAGVGTLTITNGQTAAGTNKTNTLTLNIQALTNSASSGGGANITDTNNEVGTLNIVTGGTGATSDASSFGFIANALKVVNVSGVSRVTLSGTTTESVALDGAVAATKNTWNSAAANPLTTLTVSGSASFSDGASALITTALNGNSIVGLNMAGAGLTITNTSTGTFSAALSDTTQSYTGSSGVSTIIIDGTVAATKTINGGTNVANELDLAGIGAYAQTATSAKNLTNFSVIGVGPALTGNIDMSILAPTANKLHILGSGTITFSNVATNAAVTIDGNTTSTTVGYVDATGQTDTAAVTIGKSTTTSVLTVGTLVLKDANSVGVGTLNITSSGKSAALTDSINAATPVQHVITTLTDNGLNTLGVSGNVGLDIVGLNEATTPSTSFTINNTVSSPGSVRVETLTDTVLGNVVFNGSASTTIGKSDHTGGLVTSVTTLGITNNSTAKQTVELITDANLTSLTLSSPNAELSIYKVSAAIPSLTIPANVTFGKAAALAAEALVGLQDTSTANVTINGSADNNHVTLNLAAPALATGTHTVTLGNGNNYITDQTVSGTVTITVGTGSNYIDLSTGVGASTAYSATVNLGAHGSPYDEILVGKIAAAATAPNTVISGAVAGDLLKFVDNGTTVITLTPAQLATASTQATLGAALAYADGLITTTNTAAAFVYGGNTYIIESAAAGNGTLTANDAFIELIGTHTLGTVATNVFTLAS